MLLPLPSMDGHHPVLFFNSPTTLRFSKRLPQRLHSHNQSDNASRAKADVFPSRRTQTQLRGSEAKGKETRKILRRSTNYLCPGRRRSSTVEGSPRYKYVAVTLAFLVLVMSVVVVSSPPCEKIDTDTTRFKTTFEDLTAHEAFSNFTGESPRGGFIEGP